MASDTQTYKPTVKDRVINWVSQAEPAPVRSVEVKPPSPSLLTLQPSRATVRSSGGRIGCNRLTFQEAVKTPVIVNLPLMYPIQCGHEAVTLETRVRKANLQRFRVSVIERLALLQQIPLRWPLIEIQQLDDETRKAVGQQIRDLLQKDKMLSFCKVQGLYGPVHPGKVFKVLRHPSGYLIGLPVPHTEQHSVSKPHWVVWLKEGKSKSHLVWIPYTGAMAC